MSMNKEKNTKLYRIGNTILGPIVAQFLENLLQTCRYFENEKSARILFMSRAGVRIREALDIYVKRLDQQIPNNWENFWVSRLMIAKGIWQSAPQETIKTLDSEFKYVPIDLAVKAITGTFSNDDHWHFSGQASNLTELMYKRDPRLTSLFAHLDEQSQLFRRAISELLNGYKTALVIDTGWSATSQRLLSIGYNYIDWWGAYFGLIGGPNTDRSHWGKAIPLVFQADAVNPHDVKTCLVSFRHLIELLFEPKAPSIECYKNKNDIITAIGAEENINSKIEMDSSAIYMGVLDYLRNAPKDFAQILAEVDTAWENMFQLALVPSRKEAMLFIDEDRGYDFGRKNSAPILYMPDDTTTVQSRLERTLWVPGQIALEYEDGMATDIQRNAFKLPIDGKPIKKKKNIPANNTHPMVAVITRTLDRTLFLRRALLSVHNQHYKNYQHVIVCDGGNIDLIRQIIAKTNVDHSKIVLIDNVINRGMEAASNVGIKSSQSKYIIIHDDDDTWQPEFLTKMVGFLESKEGDKYQGVVCQSLHISETVHPDGIQTHNIKPYREDFFAPSLEEMLKGNTFAPIAFLFKRETYDKIGGYNESYPVLGDWDFNIRFLEVANIGYIREKLSNYHHRDISNTSLFGNTVVAGVDKHIEYTPIVKNDILRRRINNI